jgi:hypothetical protein
MDLTKRQLIALRSPCFEDVETTDPRFASRHHLDHYVSTILTLNVGME